MQSNITLETILWFFVALAGSGIVAFLILGWIKGMYWERELRLRRKHR